MRIIFLNVLNGKQEEELTNFLETEKALTDIFCFQELHPDADKLIANILSSTHTKSHLHKDRENNIGYGYDNAFYTKHEFEISGHKELASEHVNIGSLHSLQVKTPNATFTIINVHGVTGKGDDKLDTDSRLRQTDLIISHLKNISNQAIIGGDFNILPNTKSLKAFSEAGYRDLIEEYEITETRNCISYAKHLIKMPYSDYVYTSPTIQIKSFAVPHLLISDHLPLILETV